jgi:hypothetical protein
MLEHVCGIMRSIAIIGLVLVALLSLAFAGYTILSPHTTTVTKQQFLTNTQNIYTTQTQTVTSQVTATSLTTIATTNGNGYGNYQVCGGYGCYYYPGSGRSNYPANYGYYYYNNGYYYSYYPGYSYEYSYPMYYYGYYNGNYYPPCQSTGSGGNVTCSGYLYQAGNGCTVLTIPTTSNPYSSYATGDVLEYYTLHNLPSNTPSTGTWVTVTGQFYNGPNTSSSGQSCPDNYIVVSSIS